MAAESETIEIFEHYGTYALDDPPPDTHPIIMRVPDSFLYGSSKNSRKNWGLNILTYYPAFTSPADQANAKFGLDCAGYCNGRILIAVNNRAHSIKNQEFNSPNMGDFIARSTLKRNKTAPYPSNVHVSDLTSLEGFDEGFERITTKLEDAPNVIPGHFTNVERFYFKKARDQVHYELAATCNVHEHTTCILHFSLDCDVAVYVSVNGVDGRYLDQSIEIKQKTDQFISKMIIDPHCH